MLVANDGCCRTSGQGTVAMMGVVQRVLMLGCPCVCVSRYEALWKTFGTDQSIRITFIEFATKIISHAVAKPGVEIPSRKIEDQVKMINDHLNSRLLTECEDLKYVDNRFTLPQHCRLCDRTNTSLSPMLTARPVYKRVTASAHVSL